MSTMHFADEIVPVSKVDGVPSGRSKPAPKELRLASQIIDALTSDWDPEQYHDTYTEQLRDLIAAKAKGKDVTVEAEEEEPSAKVIDLMEALEASVKAQRSGRHPAAPSRRSTKAKRTKAKKTATPSGGRKKAAGRPAASAGPARHRSSA
jgi:DNA end-binding protein Ku